MFERRVIRLPESAGTALLIQVSKVKYLNVITFIAYAHDELARLQHVQGAAIISRRDAD